MNLSFKITLENNSKTVSVEVASTCFVFNILYAFCKINFKYLETKAITYTINAINKTKVKIFLKNSHFSVG